MRYLIVMLAVLLVAAAAPLTPMQETALSDVADMSPVLDEAALYALLDNAADWEGDVTAGARIPDFAALRDQPSEYRGELFVLRGQLHARLAFVNAPQTLSRPGWEDAQLWNVQITRRDAEPIAALVYLTEPPPSELTGDLKWLDKETVRYGVPARRNVPVEVVGRFYKYVRLPSRAGQEMIYPVFVGQSVIGTGEATTDSGGGGLKGAGPTAVIVVLIALFIGAYLVFRFGVAKRQEPVRPGQKWRQQREQRQGGSGGDAEDDDELDLPDDLPEDPVEAMQYLEDQHRNASTIIIDAPDTDDAEQPNYGQTPRNANP